jgi:hypothetical protein
MAHSAEICHLKWQISVASDIGYVMTICVMKKINIAIL